MNFLSNFATWESLIHPEDGEKAKKILAECIEKTKPFEMEFRLKTKSGAWRWILGRGKVMETDAAGRPKRMVGTHVDIHDRKIMSRALERQLEELTTLNRLSTAAVLTARMQNVIDAALDQIVHFMEPDLALIYLMEDDDGLTLHGLRTRIPGFDETPYRTHPLGECLCGLAAGKTEMVFSLNIHEDRRCTHAECRAAGICSSIALPLISNRAVIGVLNLGSIQKRDFSKNGRFLQSAAELACRRKDGSVFFADVSAVGVVIDGCDCMMGLFRDATERIETEQLKQDVDRIVRHDLKTPLNAIIGFPELLLADNNLTDDQRESLGYVIDAGRQMLNMINLSLTLFQIERKTYRCMPRPFNLLRVVNRSIERPAPARGKKQGRYPFVRRRLQ